MASFCASSLVYLASFSNFVIDVGSFYYFLSLLTPVFALGDVTVVFRISLPAALN